MKVKQRQNTRSTLAKVSTGIRGLDEITFGGLPKGRPTLICGNAGCGKTLMALEFLVRGALDSKEPGVFVAFEETPQDLAQNVASLGLNLQDLLDCHLLKIDHVRVERSEIEETGEYNLDGLFVRLNYAIDSIGAKRVVLDTIESLFSGLSNTAVLRAELRRLFQWLKTKGVTAIITAERGEVTLTRQGLEEYVSDCVIVLDQRIIDQVSTRRMRIIKYRGSPHGTNEYPFLIDQDGITVFPITSLGLNHAAPATHLSTGVADLDHMLGAKGYFTGSSILISGTAGTGKSSLAGHFAQSVCRRNERCLYFAFEESEAQILRNMRSIGLDLARYVKKDLLRFHASRPTLMGLEQHLVRIYKEVDEFKPTAVIVDPISNLLNSGSGREVHSMLTRLIDFLKMKAITSVFTSLTPSRVGQGDDESAVSSLIDTWIVNKDWEGNGKRARSLCIVKSRGMAHAQNVREFIISDRGIRLTEITA